MPFTGSATVTKVTDNKFRITGVSLAIGASGTIAFTPGTGGVEFTAPDWQPHGDVALQDAVECVVNVVGAGVATAVPCSVVKTGTTQANFLITIANNDGAAVTAGLEIYVTYN